MYVTTLKAFYQYIKVNTSVFNLDVDIYIASYQSTYTNILEKINTPYKFDQQEN